MDQQLQKLCYTHPTYPSAFVMYRLVQNITHIDHIAGAAAGTRNANHFAACSTASSNPPHLLLQPLQQLMVVEGLCRVPTHAVPAIPCLSSSLCEEDPLIHTQAPVWLHCLCILLRNKLPAASPAVAAATAPSHEPCCACF
jgi:hypothetical protein